MSKQKYTDEELWEVYQEIGSKSGVARKLGIDIRGLQRRLKKIEKSKAFQGYSPKHDMTHEVPDGYIVKGVSTYYNKDNEVAGQWVKTSINPDRYKELVEEMVEGIVADLPKISPISPPDETDDQLLTIYPMGDPHFGMYAWAEEAGEDFDLAIAKRDLCSAVKYLVNQAPPTKRAVIINLGDFFHADNYQGITTRSGNVLDMDTRLPKVVRVGVSAIRQCIESALEKHETVEVINAIGNHDDVLSMVLSVMLSNIYELEPRVIIHDQPTHRHYLRHGKVLIGVTHGHMVKDRDLPLVMATEKSTEWGETKYRYFYRGHWHHDTREEYNGCVVEGFRTLAAKDAYTASHGYFSGRDMKCLIHHADYGEVARSTFSIDMLR